MGSFTFKWAHPASEVYVTGTFDDWAKSVKLEKKGDVFEKLVELPEAEDKIYYKFVVDGNWTTDHTAPQENDGQNNLNNFLLAKDITMSHQSFSEPGAGIMSGVTPMSTTAGLAGAVPKEGSSQNEPESAAISSAAPDSTTSELAKDASLENRHGLSGPSTIPGNFPKTPGTEPEEYSVDPLPATSGSGNPVNLRPGGKVPDSSTLTSRTKSSNVHDDRSLARSAEDSESSFGVAPLPATEGAGNPIHLNTGEKIPESVSSNNGGSNVTTDRESYENSGSTFPGGSQQTFGIAPLPATSGPGNPIHLQPGELVPEPSEFTANTVGSTVTTDKESYENSGSALSGAPFLPPVVTPQKEREAQGRDMFGLSPKSNNMIPESSLPMGSDGMFSERDPGFAIQSASPTSTTANLAGQVPLEPRGGPSGVPDIVKESQTEAQFDPEASAYPEEVQGKSQVEQELKREISPEQATSENLGSREGSSAVPDLVKESQAEANFSPEASAYPEEVRGKSTVEQELKREISPEPATSEDAGMTARDPLESTAGSSGVPDIVQDSYAQVRADPEASAYPEEVKEKSAVEQELKSVVPEETTTSEGTSKEIDGVTDKKDVSLSGGEAAGIAAGTAAAGGAIAAGYMSSKESPAIHEPHPGQPSGGTSSHLPPSILQSINEINSSHGGYTTTAPVESGAGVPDVVQQSIMQSIISSDGSAEAAENPEAVTEKREMEDELLSKVKSEEGAGAPAPSTSAALMESAPAPTTSKSMESQADELAAPASSLAVTPASKNAEQKLVSDSKDLPPVSPGPSTSTQTQPTVTSGVGESATDKISQPSPTTSGAKNQVTPQKESTGNAPTGTGSSSLATPAPVTKGTSSSARTSESAQSGSSTATDKKSKRRSFFGKLKDKLK
ncbi:MAG: hypothetical protein M1827_004258 [Pycnora praestabilis]|nr:MAG: hypothetical protein M1827_004258 [Pycnora praestabilis]